MSEQIGMKRNGTSIQAFGSREDVRELTERLKLMLPGGSKLGVNDVWALAQASVAHGLDPMNGEIWIIPGSGLMIGIKGLRKKAREQVKGAFSIDFKPITNPETRAAYGMGEKDLGFEARLYDSENTRLYVDNVERLSKIPGMTWEDVKEMMGAKPYTLGVGIFKASERTKMQPIQAAMKRAEADALKRRFDVPFGLPLADDDEPSSFSGPWIEGQSTPFSAGQQGNDPFGGTVTEEPAPTESENADENARLKAEWEAQLEADRLSQSQRDRQTLFPPA